MSSDFDWNNLQTLTAKQEPTTQQTQQTGSTENQVDWNQFSTLERSSDEQEPKEKESFSKNLVRTLYQPLSGYLNVTTPGVIGSLWDMLGTGEALTALDELDDQRVSELKEKFPSAPWEDFKGIDREKYLENLQDARETLPTVSNLERFVEENTGLPLQANTKLQKALKFFGSGFKITPGMVGQKAAGGAVGTAVKTGLDAAGVPEVISDVVGLAAGGKVPSASVSKVVKPSGTPVRKFEELTKPRKVTTNQAKDIRSAVEKDVRKATDKLIKENSMTSRALQEDASFPKKIDDLFSKVETLASELPSKNLNTGDLSDSIFDRIMSKPKKGVTLSESDRSYLKEMNRIGRELRRVRKISNSDLLDQFRQNNKELGQFYEPGKSKGVNSGKRDALLDYNRSIADIWKERNPESEFNKLFEFTNKRYSELSDLKTIDGFLDKVFTDKKVDYNQAKKFIKDDKIQRSFKRTLGEDGYKQVEGIFNDFLPTEKAMKLVKEAEAIGVKDIAKLSAKWLISPLFGKFDVAVKGANFLRNELLSNPKFRVTWKQAQDSFKSKDFAKAVVAMEKLDKIEKEAKAYQK